MDRLLTDMFEGVHRHGYVSLRINGLIRCQVCIFPKHKAPTPPSDDQALALVCPREQLQQELPPDAADIVRVVVAETGPTVSLGELMVRLALPLSTLQRVAQHLVYWKKARVVDVYNPGSTRVTVAPGVDTRPDSETTRRFLEWQEMEKRRRKDKPPEFTFHEIIGAFATGKVLGIVKEKSFHSCSPSHFDRIVEWLVAEDLLVQLGTFYHFLPSRADKVCGKPCPDRGVHPKIREQFQRHLTEDEMLVLAGRASNGSHYYIHYFLCRFVAEFVKKHCRTDGSRFRFLAESSSSLGLTRAHDLLAANKDILVPYVCRC